MSDSMETSITADQTLEESDIVTLGDVLQTEKDLMEDAYAVLGAADDSNCTYAEGYVKRQALYACLTCIPEAKFDESKRAGVCLACCYHCHDGHELVELYTKRNFRCDCGNSKFAEKDCNLYNEKEEVNVLNIYNQNFAGVYCNCHRPYPDPEDTVADEMIQCIICEDWFHCRHLGVPIPDNSYAEMTCEDCIKKHEFLLYYDGLTVNKGSISPVDVKIDVLNGGSGNGTSNSSEGTIEKDPLALTDSEEIPCKMPKSRSEEVCAKFWREMTWREQLCQCEDCIKMYEDQKLLFLVDPQDTVQTYEEKGKAKCLENEQNLLDKEKKFLNSLDRVPLMETLAAYEDMKDNLKEYLLKFAENKKVVREEDIREFFSNMAAKKKQKTTGPSYLCR